MNEDLVRYYKERASEYERVYAKPERQDALFKAKNELQTLLGSKHVLEIACGTGYWTDCIVSSALSVHATDINEEVLTIARQKRYNGKVTFTCSGFDDLVPAKKYDALFAGFIWSHVLQQDIDGFLETARRLLQGSGMLVFMDNQYVDGSNHPITGTDERGNTFQTRKLDDGSTHLVLKNFHTREELREKLENVGTDFLYIDLKYFWIAACELKG